MGKQNKPKKKDRRPRRPRPEDDVGDKKTDQAEDYEDTERFDSSKPQFRRPKEETSKVVLDERFSSVLTDSRFQLDVQDKYGRKKKKKEVKDELSAFYTIEEDDNNDKEGKQDDDADKEEHQSASDDESDDESAQSGQGEEQDDDDPRSRIAYLTALSRGELDVESSSDEEDGDDQSSDSDDDDGESDGEEDPVHGRAGVLDPSTREEEVVLTEDESPYLAVMSMDWSHVRAVDIFAIVSSFTPTGSVKKVQVYPSNFGMEQLSKEEKLGPTGLWKKQKSNSTEDDGSNDDSSSAEGSDDGDGDQLGTEDSASHEDDGEEEENDAKQDSTSGFRNDKIESDFDPEKLRAYETSKLRYYFAVIELASPHHADVAYKEVDGLEFENSGSVMDLRSIAPDSLPDVVKDRQLRDEATGLPSNYVPPDFIVAALQQTKVQCTWETGDHDREKALTTYASGEAWEALAEGGDLQAYMASDASSDEEDAKDNQENEKGSKMRKMLGLDSDSDEEDGASGFNDKSESTEAESSSDEESEGDEDEGAKEFKFMPGTGKIPLEDKIRAKLESKDEEKELTPWEKYQEKRKDKRREKRHEVRAKRKEVNEIRKGGKGANKPARKEDRDSFFMDKDADSADDNEGPERELHSTRNKKSKEELELLVAGEDGDEEARDYDMRGLQRIDKNKDKKLRGSRKRKEAAVAASVSGADFKVDVEDTRFAAVLEGSDDRFGIDRTDPNYKETTAMREIMAEQTRQRQAKRRKKSKSIPDISAERLSADAAGTTSGSSALSSLVKSLKSKVSKTSQ
jgi:hypothetical protein